MQNVDIDIPSILNFTGDLFIVTDSTGKILFHITQHSEIAKLARRPIAPGVLLNEIVRTDREEMIQGIINEVIKTRVPYRTEVEYQGLDNCTFHLSITYAPVFDRHNIVPKIYIIIRDITPQKIFERKLISQAKNISKLIEKSNAIIIGLDTRGYITDWNEHTAQVTGYSKNEVFAKRFADIVLPETERYSFKGFLEKILSNGQMSNQEITLITKSRGRVIALVSGTARYSSSDSVVGFALVGQDVTELMEYRKLLEVRVEERTRELLQALRKEREVVEMKNRFVSIASHEFRTPLAAIQADLEIVKRLANEHSVPALQLKANEIEKNVRHMMLLLDDVLAYGKGEAGKIQPVMSSIAIRELLQEIKEDLEKSDERTHRIETSFINITECMISDAKLLRSIFTNLLSNAIKFSPGQECVLFNAECVGGYLVVSVIDFGMGIPRNELSKVFEPFLRGSRALAIEGTGLGLSIVKKAVELLNGSITVKSQLGEGTKFTVSIPLNIT